VEFKVWDELLNSMQALMVVVGIHLRMIDDPAFVSLCIYLYTFGYGKIMGSSWKLALA